MLLQKQLQNEASTGWELSCLPRPWKGVFEEGREDVLTEAPKHTLPAIIIPEVSQENAELACAKVVKAVQEQSFEHNGNTFSIGICLGTVSARPTQNNRVHPDAMLKAATTALDSALNMGPHSVQHNPLEDEQ